ncbi:hypothetical protein OTU49_013464 [Cherax quadricarinatus]|uniref:Fibronectin type-III domain-containing protein n=1 Tax=Cherax quadricarinatus TaxID=27406 RepID=A0AAW0VTW6_CHEQU
MSFASPTNLCIPALGRPFRLGMLYDCRNDKLIQGISLWDKSSMEEKNCQHQKTSEFHIITSDSLEDKAAAFEINANMKLSFLGGLLDVSGSGKYLRNDKSSNNQERVTLQFKCTTKSEEMTMEQLGKGKVQHPDVFDHGTATHVVTGIVYGAHAFFVFERDRSSSSRDEEVCGTLEGLVKLIPTCSIDGKGQIDSSENLIKKNKNFKCTFIGDFLLRENPCTFQDAVRVYRDLPKLLGEEGQNAVPVKITLYPLTLLDSKASKLVRDISANLTSETEKVFEDLHEFTVRCNDLCNSSAAKTNKIIQKEASKFKSLITTYKCELQRLLSLLLPSIKGGGAEESLLADILRKNEESPFSYHNLQTWVQDKEEIVQVLNEYVKTFSDIKFVSQPGDLQSMIMSPEYDYTFCFRIFLPQNNSHLSKMEKYIKNEYKPESDQANVKRPEETLQTNRSGENYMMKRARLFRDFFNSNKETKHTTFIVAVDFSDTLNYEANIECYRRGGLLYENYEVLSAPGMPQIDGTNSTHDSITIVWTSPESGVSNVQKYEILCQQMSIEISPAIFRFTTSADTRSFTLTNLEVNSVYQVSVRSLCEAGVSPTSETNKVSTRPTSSPGKPQVCQKSSTTVEIQWSQPECIGPRCCIKNYIVKEQKEGTNEWDIIATTKADEVTYTTEFTPNTVPKFKIAAECGAAGCSVDSEPSDHISLKTDKDLKDEESKKIKQKLCAASSVASVGTPTIYLLQPKLVISEAQNLIRKYELGTPDHNKGFQEKVILLVGATGSGKTTLINGIINYIFDVNWTDDFRYKLISEITDGNQAKSQTRHITSYTIHHHEGSNFPNILTIIDTPGFGDTSGVMRDREITGQIQKFFNTKGSGGIDHIDVVGFVIQSSLPRLTPTQSYIFDQILSLFGKDIKNNIFLLLTFADAQKPQVLSGIKEANMPYKKHFKFNNSALYAKNKKDARCTATKDDSDEEDGNCKFDEMFWEMGVNSFSTFLKELNVVKSKSLLLTQDVLNERGQLQNYIMGIQKEIQAGLNTLETLKTETEVVKSHQADIDRNKNFTYTVNEEEFKTVEIPSGQYITNCQKCNRTCHEICGIADDNEKHGCWAITNDYCRICPKKCHWAVHKNCRFKFVLEMVQKTKTAEDLRARYEKAAEGKLSAENLISKIQDEFKAVRLKTLGMTESVRKSLERLQEIALKPNPLSTVEYIDILIESEQSEAHPGWKSRVNQLKDVRKEAEYIQKIADDGYDPFEDYIKKIDEEGYDPFEDYIKKIDEETKSNPEGPWAAAGQYFSIIKSMVFDRKKVKQKKKLN